jgi:hypothetical protein
MVWQRACKTLVALNAHAKFAALFLIHFKATVSRDWIRPCIVLMVRPWLVHMSGRFSDFVMFSSFFNLKIFLQRAFKKLAALHCTGR